MMERGREGGDGKRKVHLKGIVAISNYLSTRAYLF